jgi:hypothetical protein
MGKFGYLVNIWAVIWTAFVSIIFLFPTIRPVTTLNMNFAIVFLGAILVASAVYWVVRGKNFYTGPLIEAQFADGNDSADNLVEKKMMDHDTQVA